MMDFDALKWFGSFFKKLKKSIRLYQSHDLHLCFKSATVVSSSAWAHSIPCTKLQKIYLW